MALVSPYSDIMEEILLINLTSMALISPYSYNIEVILLINIISMALVSPYLCIILVLFSYILYIPKGVEFLPQTLIF